MDQRLAEILTGLAVDNQGIWCAEIRAEGQESELELRKAVAANTDHDLLEAVALHHSVSVMDAEVRRVLALYVPTGGIIVDVGGCWGWHWRHLARERPDVSVLIVDFLKENLLHAKRMLGAQVGRSVHLIHGDATCLPFPDESVDLFWSVQVLQHIPDFQRAVAQGRRVLRPGGWFVNYSLNRACLAECIYKLFGKDYVVAGRTAQFWLARATPAQRSVVADIFEGEVRQRFSEILFQPNFRLRTGREGALLGKLDALLSSSSSVWACVARQRSFEARKRTRTHDA